MTDLVLDSLDVVVFVTRVEEHNRVAGARRGLAAAGHADRIDTYVLAHQWRSATASSSPVSACVTPLGDDAGRCFARILVGERADAWSGPTSSPTGSRSPSPTSSTTAVSSAPNRTGAVGDGDAGDRRGARRRRTRRRPSAPAGVYIGSTMGESATFETRCPRKRCCGPRRASSARSPAASPPTDRQLRATRLRHRLRRRTSPRRRPVGSTQALHILAVLPASGSSAESSPFATVGREYVHERCRFNGNGADAARRGRRRCSCSSESTARQREHPCRQ